MSDFVALLRGVNVGGANRLPMADLRALCDSLGWRDVRSYLASGNLVFSADAPAGELAAMLRRALAERAGLDVAVLVLPGEAVQGALSACPFAPVDDRQVHVCFLLEAPELDTAMLERLKAGDEALHVAGRRAWLYTPQGFGRSRLGARLERVLNAPLTARNLRTVRALAEMLDETGRG